MDYYIVNDTLYADGTTYYPLTIEYYQVNADGIMPILSSCPVTSGLIPSWATKSTTP